MTLHKLRRFTLLLLAVMLLVTEVAYAGMQCGEALVSEGDTDYNVLKLCGKPDSVITTTREVSRFIYPYPHQKMRIHDTIIQESWTYDRRPMGLVYILNFENGRLKNVENQ